MTTTPTDPRARLGRKLLVALFAPVLLLLLAEGVLWVAGVRPALFDADPYVGFSAQVPLFTQQSDEDGTPHWRTAPNKLGFFNDQRFALEKPAGTRRVFCVGGSTTYGRPYDDTTSFCGWLRAFLAEADPDHGWEVVNAGGISYASYRVAVLMEELIRYEPDLFVVYSGQNEYLEDRTYRDILEQPALVRTAVSLLNRTRVGTAVRSLVARASASDEERELLGEEVKTRLDDVVGPEAYERDDALARRIRDHYRHNLTRMVEIARAGGAQVLFVVPASNLRDCAPFKSVVEETLTDEDRARVVAAASDVEALVTARRHDAALARADEALALDPRHAGLHYARGRALDALGRGAEAADAFQRALDEDVCPLRALSSLLPVVREVAAAHDTALVDFDALARAWSTPAGPGEDLFLDHVHPTIDAHRRLALAILDALVERGSVTPSAAWGPEAVERIRADVEARLDPKAQAQALLNLSKVVGWAGKHEEARRYAERASELDPQDPTIQYNLGIACWNTGQEERAMACYRRVLAVAPDHVESLNNLGFALQRRGQVDEAVALYRRALAADPDHVRALVNLGNVLAKRRESDEAIALYERALELEPELAQTWNNLGNAYCALGRLEEGRARYERALELNPEHPAAHHNLGNVLLHLGERAAAIEHYRAALAAKPDFPAARADLERALAGG